jgi:hypothetical protein
VVVRTPSTCRSRRRLLPHSDRGNPLHGGKMTYSEANAHRIADVGHVYLVTRALLPKSPLPTLTIVDPHETAIG